MIWKKLNNNQKMMLVQIPSDECLCINETGEMLIGYIHQTPWSNKYICMSEETELPDAIAYVLVSELKMIFDLQNSIPE